MEKVMVSVKEAALLIGLSERTIHRMIAANELDSVLIGRRRLVRRASVLSIIGD